MRNNHWKFLFVILITLACFSCAGVYKSNAEARMISEMESNCHKVGIKRNFDQAVYVMEYTGKMSKKRCPIALLRTWEDDKLTEEKEVDICGCRDNR